MNAKFQVFALALLAFACWTIFTDEPSPPIRPSQSERIELKDHYMNLKLERGEYTVLVLGERVEFRRNMISGIRWLEDGTPVLIVIRPGEFPELEGKGFFR